MSLTFQGPTIELRSARTDWLYAAIVRMSARLGVFFTTDVSTGCMAAVYKIKKLGGDWGRYELGAVKGATPISTALAVAHAYTPFSAELAALHHSYIDRLAAEVELEAHDLIKGIDGAADDLAEALAHVRPI